jgi:hypothetical protein
MPSYSNRIKIRKFRITSKIRTYIQKGPGAQNGCFNEKKEKKFPYWVRTFFSTNGSIWVGEKNLEFCADFKFAKFLSK